MCQNAQTNKEQKSLRSLTKNSIRRLSYECIISAGSYSLVSAFCLISVLIFIMIFYRRELGEAGELHVVFGYSPH